MIMFRECLKHNIIPFIIDYDHKQFYYRGLREFACVRGYLMVTCLSAQDTYQKWVKFFYRDWREIPPKWQVAGMFVSEGEKPFLNKM